MTSADPKSYLTEPYSYMFTKYQEVAWVLNCKIDEIGEAIADEHNLQSFSSPAAISTDVSEKSTVQFFPMKRADSARETYGFKPRAPSRFTTASRDLYLDAEVAGRFAVFPGQVFACDGHSAGSAFTATELFSGILIQIKRNCLNLSLYPTFESCHSILHIQYTPPIFSVSSLGVAPTITEVTLKKSPQSTPHLVVECGPYNIMDDSLPDPLKDLVLVIAA